MKPIGHRELGFTLALMLSISALALDEHSQFVAIDRAMGSQRLGTVPSRPFGRLVADGEGGCNQHPYSACEYSDGGYLYYYSDGTLISKEFTFQRSTLDGPFGIGEGDRIADVVRKLDRYLAGREPIKVGDGDYFYGLDCPPMLCRLSIKIEADGIKSMRLFYGDAL